jgi:uncharacterized protein (TIRG00374 family)
MKRTSWVFSGLGFVISIGILWYLLQEISFREVLQIIKDAKLEGVVIFLVLSISMTVFRTWRYAVLLQLSGYNPKRFPLFLITLVRNFFSDLLPAKLGGLMYVFLVTTRLGIKADAALSSFAYAFIFDILAVSPLLLGAIVVTTAPAELPVGILIGGAITLFGISFALLKLLPFFAKLFERIVRSVPLLSTRLRTLLQTHAAELQKEFTRTDRSGAFTELLLLSIATRLCKYGGMYALLYALLQPMGYKWGDLNFGSMLLGFGAAELAVSLPIASIGGFGVYQGAWSFAFHLLGFPTAIAKITSFSHHIVTQGWGYGLGLVALFVLLLPLFQTQSVTVQGRATFPHRIFFAKFIFFVIFIAALCAVAQNLLADTSLPPVMQTVNISREEAHRRDALLEKLPGTLLFDSNRSGSFGIYTLENGNVRAVIDTTRQETAPAPSPDGQEILFASALSMQRHTYSEIWIVNRDGSNPRLVAKNGDFPSFSQDGKWIYFERNNKHIIRVASPSKHGSTSPPSGDRPKAKVIFPRKGSKFGNYSINKPRVAPDEKSAVFFSDKGGRWTAWYANLQTGTTHQIGHGCEPSFTPSGEEIVWVGTAGALDGSGIFRYQPSLKKIDPLEDRNAPWGHEYFPRVDLTGTYLLYGACPTGQHSHLDANYQIFVKELATGATTRLTFDSFTNRWPILLPK